MIIDEKKSKCFSTYKNGVYTVNMFIWTYKNGVYTVNTFVWTYKNWVYTVNKFVRTLCLLG